MEGFTSLHASRAAVVALPILLLSVGYTLGIAFDSFPPLYGLRRATVAEIDAKKEVLAARVRCIDMAFSRAEEKLCDIDTATYLAFIEAMLVKYADDGDVVVVAKNAKVDREDIKRLAVFGEKHLTLGEDGDFSGGLVLSGKKYDKSLTFKSLLQETRSVLQSEVFAKLVKR